MGTDRTCEICDDGEGGCMFPYYGVAPHTHKPGPIIGSTELLDEPFPEHFVEDPECPGLGTYTNCPLCGDPK
jgi:hypothetical protein